MAKYKVLERSFINDRLHEEGDTVEYDGVPGANLQPVDAAAKAAAKEAAASGVPLDVVDSGAGKPDAGTGDAPST